MGYSWTAAAKVDIDEVNAVCMDNNEMFMACGPPLTDLTWWVAQLNTKSQVAQVDPFKK